MITLIPPPPDTPQSLYTLTNTLFNLVTLYSITTIAHNILKLSRRTPHPPSRKLTITLLLLYTFLTGITLYTLRFDPFSHPLPAPLAPTKTPMRSFDDLVFTWPTWTQALRGILLKNYHEVLPVITQALPFVKEKKVATVWSNFGVVMADSGGRWWAGQWVVGYALFAVWVGVEMRNARGSRGVEGRVAGALVWVAWVFGLCVGMALAGVVVLLVGSEGGRRKGGWWIPHGMVTPVGLLVFVVWQMPSMLEKGTGGFFYNSSLSSILAFPVTWAHELHKGFDEKKGRTYRSAREGKNAMSVTWYALTLFAIGLHLYATLDVLTDSDTRWWKAVKWSAQQVRHVITDEEEEGTVAQATSKLAELAVDEPWAAALMWDVIFSVAGLACWSVFAKLNVRTMLECTMFPWVDEVLDFVEEGTGRAIPYLENMAEQAEPVLRRGRRGARKMVKDTAPYLGDAQNAVGSAMEQASGAINSTVQQASDLADEYNVGPRAVRRKSQRMMELGNDVMEVAQGRRRSQSRGGSGRSRSRKVSAAATRAASQAVEETTDVKRPRGSLVAGALTIGLWMFGGLGMACAGVFGGHEVE